MSYFQDRQEKFYSTSVSYKKSPSVLMSLLNVPYLAQVEPGGCLQACAAMVLAYLGQPAYQGDIDRQK